LSKVIIEKLADYDLKKLRQFLEKAFSLIPPEKRIRPGERVLVKPNFLWPKPVESAVCTHPAVIYAVCEMVLDLGARPVVGDSPSRGSAQLVAEKIGLVPLAKRLGVEILNFAHLKRVEIKEPLKYHFLDLSEESLEFDRIINLAKFKTHAFLLLTLGVKNLFGCVAGARKAMYHLESAYRADLFTLLLLEIYRYFSPSLTIMDGIIAMEGNGPNNGEPRKLGLFFASTDAVALDRVCGEVVNFPFDYNLTAFLGEKFQVGKGRLEEIEIIGMDLEEVKIKDFQLPHPGPPEGEKIPRLARRIFKRRVYWRPEFDQEKCQACGICVEVCPSQALSLVPKERRSRKKIQIDRSRCISCFCCQEVCPEGAIHSERGWLGRLLMR